MLRLFTDSTQRPLAAVLDNQAYSTGGNGGWLAFPAYWPEHVIDNLVLERCSLDYIYTSRSKRLGQHDCRNLQVTASAYCQPPFEAKCGAYDPLYALRSAGNVLVKPAMPYAYSSEQLMTLSKLNSHFEYQEGNAPSGLLTDPSHAFLSGGSVWVRTSSGIRKSSTFYSTVCASCYSLSWNNNNTRAIVTRVYAVRSDEVNFDGSLRSTFTDVGCTVFTYSPRSSGNIRYYSEWYLRGDHTWSQGTVVQYPLPSGFERTPPVPTINQYLENPSMLSFRVFEEKFPTEFSTSQPLMRLGESGFTGSTDEVLNTISGHVLRALNRIDQAGCPVDFNELSDSVADNTQGVSINTVAYINEAGGVFGTVKETLSLLDSPTNPKAWAKWWLSLRYGDRLTFSDTSALLKQAGSELRKLTTGWRKDFYKSHSRSTASLPPALNGMTGSVTGAVTALYRPRYSGVFPSIYHLLDKWDLWPTLSDAWDLVPFSFVVDWFVDIQDCLEVSERYNRLLMLDILSVAQSTKWNVHLPDVQVGNNFIHNLSFVLYNRDISCSLPVSPFRVERGHLSAINIIDGISLLYAG